jgi:hypothetical protein
MHNNFLVERSGKMSEVLGRVPPPATADRPWLSPAGLSPDVPAGALSQRTGVQLGRPWRGIGALKRLVMAVEQVAA